MKWKRKLSNRKRWVRNHLITKDGNKCALCRKTFESMKDITLDHITPISKNGTDEIDNLQLTHFECNQQKEDMTQEEFDEFQTGRACG